MTDQDHCRGATLRRGRTAWVCSGCGAVVNGACVLNLPALVEEPADARPGRTAIYHAASEAAQEMAEGLAFYADQVDGDLLDFMREESGSLVAEAVRVFMFESVAGARS